MPPHPFKVYIETVYLKVRFIAIGDKVCVNQFERWGFLEGFTHREFLEILLYFFPKIKGKRMSVWEENMNISFKVDNMCAVF